LASQVSRHLLRGGGEVLVCDDVVPIEHVAGSVTAYHDRQVTLQFRTLSVQLCRPA